MCSTSMCISAYFSAQKKTAAMAAVIFIMIRVNCQGPLLVWNRLINSSSSSFKQRCQARRCSASSRQKSTRSFVLRWSTLRLKLTHSRKKISQCIWRLWKILRNANWYFVKLQNPKQGKKLFQQKLDAINTLKILQFNYTIFLFLIYFFLIFPISKYLCLLAAAFRSFFLRF